LGAIAGNSTGTASTGRNDSREWRDVLLMVYLLPSVVVLIIVPMLPRSLTAVAVLLILALLCFASTPAVLIAGVPDDEDIYGHHRGEYYEDERDFDEGLKWLGIALLCWIAGVLLSIPVVSSTPVRKKISERPAPFDELLFEFNKSYTKIYFMYILAYFVCFSLLNSICNLVGHILSGSGVNSSLGLFLYWIKYLLPVVALFASFSSTCKGDKGP